MRDPGLEVPCFFLGCNVLIASTFLFFVVFCRVCQQFFLSGCFCRVQGEKLQLSWERGGAQIPFMVMVLVDSDLRLDGVGKDHPRRRAPPLW